jgi:hypothetical protein
VCADFWSFKIIVYGCYHVLPYILVTYTLIFGECITHIWWNIYIFFGHVVLVEEPPAVTNIFSVPEPKILVTASGSSTNTT